MINGKNVFALGVEIGLLIAYKALLDFVFTFFILPAYSYMPHLGLYGEVLEESRLFTGYLLLLVLWLIVRPILRNPQRPVSRLLVGVLFFILIVPAFTVHLQSGRPIQHLLYIVLGFLALTFAVRAIPTFRIPLPSREIFWLLVISFLVFVIYAYLGLFTTGGLSRINFNLRDVYIYRAMYVEAQFPLAGYVISWVGYVLNPTCLIYALIKKNFILAITVLMLQALLFAMTNFKAFIFLPIVILAFWFLRLRIPFQSLLPWGSIVFLLLSLIGAAWGGEVFFLGIVYRALFTPAALSSLYFDLFTMQPKALMSGSPWVANLYQPPYPTSAVSLIAQEYWGRDFSPNANWIAQAYADFGEGGIILFGLALALFSRIADMIAVSTRYKGVGEAVFLGPTMALVNTAFTRFLLTSGGLVGLLALWALVAALNQKRWRYEDKSEGMRSQ